MKTHAFVRHNIKRVARLLGSEKVDVDTSMIKLQEILYLGAERLLISFDWAAISNLGYETLKATVVVAQGRGIPVMFKTYKLWNNEK